MMNLKQTAMEADAALRESFQVVRKSVLADGDPTAKDMYALKTLHHFGTAVNRFLSLQKVVRQQLKDIDASVTEMKAVYKEMQPEYFK